MDQSIQSNIEEWVDPDENILWVYELPNANLEARNVQKAFEDQRYPVEGKEWGDFIDWLSGLLSDEYVDGFQAFSEETNGNWEVRVARRSPSEVWTDIKAAYDDTDVMKRDVRQQAVDQLRREFQCLTMAETEELYYYDREAGIYRSDGERVVREQLEDRLREHATRREVNEILHKLKAGRSRTANEFRGPNDMVCVENGVIDVSSPSNPTLRTHSPEDEFRSRLPVEFDPDADYPTWKDCLDQWVSDEDDRQKLQEFVGYCLHHWDQPFQKALLLVGPTGSGKSTFLNVVNELLGHENVANQSLQALANQRFAKAELYEKFANIYNDLDAASVQNPGVFKTLTAGDSITVERKNKDPFRFQPTQKLLFAANQVPSVDHDDDAFYRRWHIVEFSETIPSADRNPNLEDELLEELPGILNWTLDGYAQLMRQGQFTENRDIVSTRSFWRSYGTSIEQFLEEKVDIVPEAKTPEDDVYDAYCEFCYHQGLPSRPKQTVTKELKWRANVEQTRPNIDGERIRCYSGIALSDGDSLVTDSEEDNDENSGWLENVESESF
ncbi:phage/plasmid primase, P4 family [Halalkalicoccus tibetensis]|uniref:Phage/plasmid primase, P4 family n=1 Tax=Halalkalicoccus tibetensis TaxID=175632 RepID=A0ABD5V4M6_9EURY